MNTFNIDSDKEYTKIDLDYTLALSRIMSKLEYCDIKLREVLDLSIKILHKDLRLDDGRYDILTLSKLTDLIVELRKMRVEACNIIDFIYALNNSKSK